VRCLISEVDGGVVDDALVLLMDGVHSSTRQGLDETNLVVETGDGKKREKRDVSFGRAPSPMGSLPPRSASHFASLRNHLLFSGICLLFLQLKIHDCGLNTPSCVMFYLYPESTFIPGHFVTFPPQAQDP
jgi:hypothetical protein